MVVVDASRLFHPFQDFNLRLGLSVSHLQTFSPTADSLFTYYTDEVRARLNQSIQAHGMTSFLEGEFSSRSAPSKSPPPPSPLEAPSNKVDLQPSRTRPLDYDSTLEDWWSDGEDVKSYPPVKNGQVVIEDTKDDE